MEFPELWEHLGSNQIVAAPSPAPTTMPKHQTMSGASSFGQHDLINHALLATFQKYDGDGDERMNESEVRLTTLFFLDKQAGKPKEAMCISIF